ncbi:MAG: MgtC/SapB family protein, partial [Oscillospiraceae bacterium]|nr:MgtC/SapB family protein [Oscillospiraceae bacterium]
LVMLTAVYMSTNTNATIDVSRMSASVITGIGFIGAGTILREGFSVKGLTTAASLWAVACIGTAVGGGYITGAIVATIVTYLTLNSLKRFVIKGSVGKTVFVEVESIEKELSAITSLIKDKYNTSIHSTEIINTTSADKKYKHKKNNYVIKILTFPKNDKVLSKIVSGLKELEGVEDVYVE